VAVLRTEFFTFTELFGVISMSILRCYADAATRRAQSAPAFTSLRSRSTQKLCLAFLFICVCMAAAAQSKVATTTTLALTTSSGPAKSVSSGTVVTLTATVTPASGTIKAGQVNFCDASSKYCTDIHLLGTAQLTSAGKSALKLRPGIGSHSYKAEFLGTNSDAASSSSASALTVTGIYPTTTIIAQVGIPNNYTLTATVTGVVNLPTVPAPTGSVSFADTSNKNAVLGAAPLGSLATGLNFFNSSSPATVSEPNVVAAADFNGDGFIDLAVSNSNSGGTTLTILLGNGDGTFTATATSPAVGLYPDSIVVADFNGDGIPDLAVTSVDQNLITVLLGNGDGTFTAAPDLDTVTTPQCVVTGDFNGDGIPDLAVINANSALIFLGNGDGTFKQAASSPALSGSPVKMTVGDFNNDGIADLAITNSLENGLVLIFLGKGDGTFTAAPTNPAAGTSAVGIATGDFNGDGNLDLAVSEYGADSTGAVAILLGNGDGSFKPAVFYSGEGLNFESVAVLDLNGDGIADLALGQFWFGPATVLLGKGDGTFENGQAVDASVPLSSGYLAAADFNGDGVPDLAIPNQDVSGTVVVLLTQNTQTLTATLNNVAPPGPGTHQVVASYPGDQNYSSSTSAATALQSQVATPVLSLAQGTYTSVQTLAITDATPGATIYYEAAGGLSTNGFVAYTGPITLSNAGTEVIQVYASETGYLQSNYVTVEYTLVLPPTATPTISLAAGYYAGPQTVTITDSAAGAMIYYTTNGTPPTLNSNLYSGPIAVSSSETLVAAAVAYGYSFSSAASAQYVIGSSPVSLIYTVAGTGTYGYTGDGGLATLAELDYPRGLVNDGAGNLFFSDDGNHMVRKVAAGTGIISIVAGTGTIGYSGDGGPATSAELSSPDGLALDTLGNLFIADNGNGTVRKVNLTSGIITTYAGNPTATAPGDGGQATAASLGYIGGIAIDASRNVYIAEEGMNTIREVNDGTGIITTIAGTGSYGFSGDNGPASNAAFRSPYGMAFDGSGNLYIADGGNNVVRKVTAVNGVITGTDIITTVAGTGSGGFGYPPGGYSGDGGPATSAKLNLPLAVAFDSSGNLYISDSNNSVVRLVTASTEIISTVAGDGVACGSYGGDGGNATSASLCDADGIAVDKAGNLFIADALNNRIREVVAPGTPPSTQAAAPAFSVLGGTYASSQTVTLSDTAPGASIYVSVNGETPTTATAPGYSFPIDVAGVVTLKAIATAPGYLTSTVSSATYTVTSFAPIITTVAGNGTTDFGASGGPAPSAEFGLLQDVAVDKAENIYVSDSYNNVVWMISATTGVASLFAGDGTAGYTGDGGAATSATLRGPQGIALDSTGNLYIADVDNNVVRKVTAGTGIISTFAGGPYTYGGNIGDGGPATSASLAYPTAVAVDGANNLYIADTDHYVIREVSATTGIIMTVAGNGTYPFGGDGGPATKAGLQTPYGLAVDPAGNLYIEAANAGRIRKVTASTRVITTVAGVGDILGDTGNGGQATSAEIAPQAISADSAGNLYISNWPGEIREVNASTGVITKVAGIGFGGFSGDGGAATVAELLGPTGMAFDSAGNLVFADTYNYRVRKVTFTEQATATPVFSVASGTYPTAQVVSITDTTPGATIYYTTDGTGPTTSSTVYSGPITVSSSETIQAIGVAVDYNASAVASAVYVISIQAPTPSLTSLSPAFTSAGSAAFTLTVNGSAFTSASTVYWGTTALTTQYVSATQLTAQVPASDIATAGITSVTAQTPAPGGGTSNTLRFEVDTAGSATPPSFPTTSVTVTAGATATYPVTLPSSATNVSVTCLNLPTGAACSYSASAGTLTITTASSTPTGTYQITVVFTETLPGAAAALALLPFLLLPLASANKRKAGRLWIVAGVGLVFVVLAAGGGCGGGGGGLTTPPPQTHQVTSSGTVTLIVQ